MKLRMGDRIRLAYALLPPGHRLVLHSEDYQNWRWRPGIMELANENETVHVDNKFPRNEIRMACNMNADGSYSFDYVEIPLLAEIEQAWFGELA
jgi:hypothetical protein